jgi:Na+/alanine symporter
LFVILINRKSHSWIQVGLFATALVFSTIQAISFYIERPIEFNKWVTPAQEITTLSTVAIFIAFVLGGALRSLGRLLENNTGRDASS